MKNFKKVIILVVWILTVLIAINTAIVFADIVISRALSIERGGSAEAMYTAKMCNYYKSWNPITKSMADRDATLFSRAIVTLFGVHLRKIFITIMNQYNAWKRKNRKARVN